MDSHVGVVVLFVLLISCVTMLNGENSTNIQLGDEEESDESISGVRNDPSDLGVHGREAGDEIGQIDQIIRLGTSNGMECPHSCFCEVEDSYVSCIGDGLWSPPLLPSSMTRLELRSFYLPELESLSVQLPGLQELQLQQCNLSKLHQDAFITVTTLDRLDLSQNHLEILSLNTLRGLASLRHLDLSSNLLNNLSRPFTHLLSLEHLNLRNNKLKELDADTFAGLNKVQYVNLDGNVIEIVNVAAFQHLGSLAHLILSNNPLANLARLNFFGSRLQYIDVSNIGIERVPQALTQFVRDLRLAKNRVKEIHRGDLDSYPYLGLLVLDDNGLEVLEEDALGRHEYLSRLWLNGNKLQTIPQSLPISLRALYIEENRISSLRDGDFAGLSNLEQIFMQRNQIVSISSCAFCDLSGLKTLDLQANNLTNISESVFNKLSELKTLDLSQNPLLTLSSNTFKGLGFIRVLQISRIHTNISISENLFDPLKSLQILEMYGSPSLVNTVVNSSRLLHSLRGLRELNLMHNELTSLRNDFFSFYPKLSLIKLSGNSWDCSRQENILWLKHWMQNSPINFYRSFSVRCSNPPSLGFKPILLLEGEDFEHLYKSTATPLPKLLSSFTTTSLLSEPTTLKTERNNFKNFSSTTSSSSKVVKFVTSKYNENNNYTPLKLKEKFDLPFVPTTKAKLNILTNFLTSFTTKTKLTTKAFPETDSSFNFNTIASFNSTSPTVSAEKYHKLNSYSKIRKKTLKTNSNESTGINIMTTKPASSVLSETTTLPYWSIHNRRPKTKILLQGHLNTLVTIYPTADSFSKAGTKNISSNQEIDPRKLTNLYQQEPVNNESYSSSPFNKELWIYRGDATHGFVEHQKGVSVHSLHKHDNAVVIGAGIVSAFVGITLIVGGYILARGISKKNRRISTWENSLSSYWNGRESEEGELISEGVVVGIGNIGTGMMRETEGTVGMVTESHHGLNNRLYLLLQRDSSTGITPESLPDPTVTSSPSIISSDIPNSNSKLFM